jgi:four helix bundle protein
MAGAAEESSVVSHQSSEAVRTGIHVEWAMQDFHQLKVWEKAHNLAVETYRITRSFPRSEVFGLQSQMRRASVSVASNIAEGSGRSGRAQFAQFLNQALGSASELEYQLLLAKELDFILPPAHERATADVVEVKRMLAALLRRVRSQTRQEAWPEN